MPHPTIDPAHLPDIHTDRFRRDPFFHHDVVNLPDSPAVRTEVRAMLHDIAADSPPVRPARVSVAARLRNRAPRWFGWLRAMPLP